MMRLGGGLGPLPVALHHVVAADDDLADLTLGHLVALVVDDPHLHVLDRRADRAGLALAVGVVERRHRRALREPVALEDLAAERLVEPAQELDGHRRAARPAQPQSAHVVGLALGVMEHRAVHRGHALEDVDLVALDDLQRLARLEARQQGQRATAPDRRVHPAGLAEGVKQRQRPEHHRLAAQVEQIAGPSGVERQVGVGELGTLGLARGARRVEQHRGVIVGRVGDGRVRRGRAHLLLEVARLDEQALGARLLGAGLGVVGEPVPGEDQLGPRVRQVVGDLALLEQHVHRHDDAAGPQHAVVADREVRDVGQHDPDPVAALEAVLAPAARRCGPRRRRARRS